MPKKQLIIIPGLGGRVWLYNFVKPIWTLLGFDVCIFNFHWGDNQLVFNDLLNSLLRFIDGLNSKEVYVIGVSAGGTVAVNALVSRPNSIIKIVTICAPYKLLPNQKNKLLIKSINRMIDNIQKMSDEKKSRISPIHGFCDLTVPYAKVKPENINVQRIFSIGHSFSIIMALTVYSGMVKSFLIAMR